MAEHAGFMTPPSYLLRTIVTPFKNSSAARPPHPVEFSCRPQGRLGRLSHSPRLATLSSASLQHYAKTDKCHRPRYLRRQTRAGHPRATENDDSAGHNDLARRLRQKRTETERNSANGWAKRDGRILPRALDLGRRAGPA